MDEQKYADALFVCARERAESEKTWSKKYDEALVLADEINKNRKILSAKLNEAVELLRVIKKAVDEYDADMNVSLYKDINFILSKYE